MHRRRVPARCHPPRARDQDIGEGAHFGVGTGAKPRILLPAFLRIALRAIDYCCRTVVVVVAFTEY